MTILMRRFAIVCLSFAVFAIAMTMAVNSQSHRMASNHTGLAAPCPQPAGIHCTMTK